jgi:hypothetical protein
VVGSSILKGVHIIIYKENKREMAASAIFSKERETANITCQPLPRLQKREQIIAQFCWKSMLEYSATCFLNIYIEINYYENVCISVDIKTDQNYILKSKKI